jgi:hypothetical protein
MGGTPAWGLGERLKTPHTYVTLQSASEVLSSCEHGNEPLGSINVGNFLTS